MLFEFKQKTLASSQKYFLTLLLEEIEEEIKLVNKFAK